MADFDATAFAADVPVYVRAAGDGYELVDTASGETLSTHAKLREALDAALEHGIPTKAPVLHDDAGEPNGVWRWFPAATEEASVNEEDGFRMSRANVWQFASDLNTGEQPYPIDGGPQPEGMRPSEVHGTASDTATPANGWAHAGVVYVDAKDRHALILRGEILPEIAPEVDRGRLAFGSVHFSHTKIDETGQAAHVRFQSFALTNRPVDTQLQAASTVRAARDSNVEPSRVLARSRRLSMSAEIEKSRGAAMDAFVKIASAMGIDPVEDLNDESYCSKVVERVYEVRNAAKQEQAVDAVNGGGGEIQQAETPEEERSRAADFGVGDRVKVAPGKNHDEMTKDAEGEIAEIGGPALGIRFDGMDGVHRWYVAEELVDAEGNARAVSTRAVEGLEGEALDAFAASVIALMREVLGKADATPEELLTEFGARKEALAAAMGVAASPNPSGTPAEDNAMAEENKNDGGDAERARAKDQTQLIAERARAKKLEQDLETANAKLRAIENEKRLDEELKKRGLTLSDEDRQTMLRSAEKFGWDFVAVSLRSHHTPPTGEVMRGKPAEETVRRARSLKEAVAAEEKAVFEDAKLRGQPRPSDAKAHRLAIKRLRTKSPDLFANPETATR